MIVGADVWYSVLGGLFPEVCLKIVKAAQGGNTAEARKLNLQLKHIWELFEQYSSLRVAYELANGGTSMGKISCDLTQAAPNSHKQNWLSRYAGEQ